VFFAIEEPKRFSIYLKTLGKMQFFLKLQRSHQLWKERHRLSTLIFNKTLGKMQFCLKSGLVPFFLA